VVHVRRCRATPCLLRQEDPPRGALTALKANKGYPACCLRWYSTLGRRSHTATYRATGIAAAENVGSRRPSLLCLFWVYVVCMWHAVVYWWVAGPGGSGRAAESGAERRRWIPHNASSILDTLYPVSRLHYTKVASEAGFEQGIARPVRCPPP
jgi:hypothetical protein